MARKTYRAVFKCRLCGETYTTCTCSEILARRTAQNACDGIFDELHGLAPQMNEIHNCSNGNIGIADFQGYELMEEENES